MIGGRATGCGFSGVADAEAGWALDRPPLQLMHALTSKTARTNPRVDLIGILTMIFVQPQMIHPVLRYPRSCCNARLFRGSTSSQAAAPNPHKAAATKKEVVPPKW